MYDAILFPTDGSPCAQGALPHAVSLAERFEATLHALFVVRTAYSRAVVAEAPVVLDSMQRTLEETGRKVLASVTGEAERAGISSVTRTLEDPSVGKGIRAYADEEDIDLVVMATHGRSGVRRFLFGSIAEDVLRRSETPLYLVPCDEGD